MRLLFSVSALLLGLLLTCQVTAESERTHAAERVFAYLLYRLEAMAFPGLPYDSPEYWIATGCSRGKNRRCTFNEFLTWISKGTNSGTPGYYELPSHNLNPLATKDELSTVINNMVTKDTLQDLIKDEFRVANVIEARPGLPGNGYAKLYSEKYAEFLTQVYDAINKLPAGENQRNAIQVYQTARDLSRGIIFLRRGATMGKLYDELTRVFPDKHPSNYYTYVENGVTKRRDPIKWISVQKSFGSHTWLELDLAATKQANLATYTAIEPEITKRMMMFEADDIKTVTWNSKFPRSNRNHNAVIFHMNEMRLQQPGWNAC